MDSRRPKRSDTSTTPLHLTRSGKAAFSLEKELVCKKQNSDAGGRIAGVFIG
jgi:hypothetical protein